MTSVLASSGSNIRTFEFLSFHCWMPLSNSDNSLCLCMDWIFLLNSWRKPLQHFQEHDQHQHWHWESYQSGSVQETDSYSRVLLWFRSTSQGYRNWRQGNTDRLILFISRSMNKKNIDSCFMNHSYSLIQRAFNIYVLMNELTSGFSFDQRFQCSACTCTKRTLLRWLKSIVAEAIKLDTLNSVILSMSSSLITISRRRTSKVLRVHL